MSVRRGQDPLEIKGLSKSYSDLHVIQNFTASIARGEKIALLLGRNGAGEDHHVGDRCGTNHTAWTRPTATFRSRAVS